MKLFQKIRSHLLQKMLLGYILLLLLPCILFSGFYLYVTQDYFTRMRRTMEQETLSQYCVDIENDMKLCENVYLQIRQHNNFLYFLNGGYKTSVDQLVLYTRELSTMFTYAKNYSPYIDKIQVYAFRNDLLTLDNYLKDIDELGEFRLDKSTENGYWRYDETKGRLIYRRTIRNISLNSALGIIEITCKPNLLTDKLSSLSGSLGRKLYAILGDKCYELTENNLLPIRKPETLDQFLEGQLGKLSLQIRLEKAAEGFGSPQISNVLTLTALITFLSIGLLSTIYFYIVAQLSKRIVAFSRHIFNAFDTVPDSYHDKGNDEFHLLVDNFNQMLENNNRLINQIKLEQLRQHEMAYKVLQAQIDPHFICNALESVRMLAEMHDESDISNMIFSLSRLLRYTFSANTREVSLASELDLVEQYLKIQKLRLGNRLFYQISCSKELGTAALPQFTIQPLAENAIKYGLVNSTQSIHLNIEVVMKKELLSVAVENDGAGMDNERQERINELLESGRSLSDISSGTGVGLDSINSRMRYYYSKTFSMKLCEPRYGTGLLVILSWDPAEKKSVR